MKRVLFVLGFMLLLAPMINAEIIMHQQPEGVYNLGDSLTIPVTVKSNIGATGVFSMDLICNGQITNFYMNGVSLGPGQEKKIEASLILDKGLIGESKGKCLVKGVFGSEFKTSDEFILSNQLTIQPELTKTEFVPGESLLIEGNVLKDNGEAANGFIELELVAENSTESIEKLETVSNGYFSLNITLKEGMKAQKYLLKLNAYEKDYSGQITNKGYINQNIQVVQIPTSLEIVFEDEEAVPGKDLKVKAILHDQTGQTIDALATITLENNKSKTVLLEEVVTDEFLNTPIVYNEEPLMWRVFAEAEGIKNEATFMIGELRNINISIVNTTARIANAGNVPYNESVVIKIGNTTTDVLVLLGVDQVQEYKLRAPEGEYEVSIVGEDHEYTQKVFLTGRAVDVKAKGTGSKVGYSLAWIFVLLVLGLMANMFFKKGAKKTFWGYMPRFKKKRKPSARAPKELDSGSLLKARNKAEVSLSIKGDKQKATTVCLKIKNLGEIQSQKSNAEETLQKLIDFAESKKSLIYENQGNIFFMLAPVKTKTFKNESVAFEIARAARRLLLEHNKLFKQRIEFGLSINNGIIVAKEEPASTKFMSMGTFISGAKKIALMSKENILLSKDLSEALKSEIKAEKFEDNPDVYFVKEIKKYDPASQKFIENFVRKLEHDSKK